MPLSLGTLRPAPLATRLWQGGGIVAAVILTIVGMNFVLPANKTVGREMLGHDFLAFYTAGTVVRQGDHAKLYDLPTTQRIQRDVGRQHQLDLGAGFGPFWNPPFYALLFVPFASLPYPAAVSAWVTINILCAAAAIALLCRIIARAAGAWPGYERAAGTVVWKYWLLVPVLVCFSMPFLQAISHGQNTFMSLLLLTGTVALWRVRRAWTAGIVCGLLFYKPQLAAIVAGMLTITLGWRALAGILISGLLALALGELAMPGSLDLYVHQLPANLAFMQVESPYLWERHATLKSFWRLLLQGQSAGEMVQPAMIAWAATTGLVALGLAAVAWQSGRRARQADDVFAGPTRAQRLDRTIAATIAAMPLLMPFYFDYDLLLLAIPFTLMASERIREGGPIPEQDRTLIKASVMLFLWVMINPGVARDSGINVTVLLLSAVAALFIARACRDHPATVIDRHEELAPNRPAPLRTAVDRNRLPLAAHSAAA